MDISTMSIAKFLGSKVGSKIFEEVSKKLTSPEIDVKFIQAIDTVSGKLQDKYPNILGGDIDIFFKEDEIFNELVKLLFRKSKVNKLVIEDKFDISSLPLKFIEEFIFELKQELLNDRDFDEILSNNEIYVSILGIDEKVESIERSTELSSKEILKIRQLLEERFNDTFSYEEFYDAYRKVAINNLSQVNYIGLGLSPEVRKSRKKLQDIFVKPEFSLLDQDTIFDENEDPFEEIYDEDEDETTTFEELFDFEKHLVILGKPGAGKSVLVKYIMCSILLNKKIEFNGKCFYKRLPFRIELRKYLSYKKENSGNITRYICKMLETEYGLVNLSEKQIIRILTEKSTLIFFDGLDEIFDVKDKIEVKNDIENFLKLYERSFGVVTSRLIGYSEASLNNNYFSELKIRDFDQEKVVEYVVKWYSCEELNEEIRDREVQTFLELKHEISDELIRNPLLLSLIVILYRNNGKLPNSKLEIYRSCTRTLVDKWDENKQLDIDIKVKNKKDNIFTNLAFWQYEQLSNKGTLTYQKVLNQISLIITEKLKLTEDAIEATKWAEEFLEYAKKRSLYFDNNFTHKTFLEFYTAFWIYQNYDLKGKQHERNNIIAKYITNSFWFIVLELIINLIDENQCDNEVIDELIKNQIKRNDETYIFFLHVLSSIKNVSDQLVEELIRSSIKLCLTQLRYYTSFNTRDTYEYNMARKLFDELECLLRNPTFGLIVQKNYDLIYDKIKHDERLLVNYYIFGKSILFGLPDSAPIFEISNDSGLEQAKTLDPYLYQLCTISFNSKEDSNYLENTITFVEKFGIDNLYESYVVLFRFRLPPYIWYYLGRQLSSKNIDNLLSNLFVLELKGLDAKTLIKNHLALFSYSYFDMNVRWLNKLNHIMNQTDNKEIKAFLLLIVISSFKFKRVLQANKLQDGLIKELVSIPGETIIFCKHMGIDEKQGV